MEFADRHEEEEDEAQFAFEGVSVARLAPFPMSNLFSRMALIF